MDFAVGETGGEEIAGFHLRGIFDNLAVRRRGQRITTIKNAVGRKEFKFIRRAFPTPFKPLVCEGELSGKRFGKMIDALGVILAAPTQGHRELIHTADNLLL